MREQELAKQHLIFSTITGSVAYGTNTPESDTDIRGIFIAPPEYVLGLNKTVENIDISGEDTSHYELGKFVKLAAECNPNVIELLYSPENCIQYSSVFYEKLRANRHLFLSKKAKFTFTGYAFAQLKRIKGHNKWINNPQSEIAPHISQFCTFFWTDGSSCKLTEAQFNSVRERWFLVKGKGEYCFRIFSGGVTPKNGLVSDDGTQMKYIDISEERLSELRANHAHKFEGLLLIDIPAFKEARDRWNQYWTWKKNRNPDRAKLEEQYGFDGKHAGHLIRLTRMAREILTQHTVIVNRPDAQELLNIRLGTRTYDDLIKEAEANELELEKLYEDSTLQHSADYAGISKLLMDLRLDYWRTNGLL